MGAIYAVINPATGALTGGFYDNVLWPILPANAVGPLAPNDYQTWAASPQGYTWNGAGITAVAAASNSVSGYSTIAAGVTVHCLTDAALNATYAADPLAMADLAAKTAYVVQYAAFPGGLATLSIADTGGAAHSFPTTAKFLEFTKALQDYVTLCQQFDLGVAGVALPGGIQIIS